MDSSTYYERASYVNDPNTVQRDGDATLDDVVAWLEFEGIDCLTHAYVTSPTAYAIKHTAARALGLYVSERLMIDAVKRYGYPTITSDAGTHVGMDNDGYADTHKRACR